MDELDRASVIAANLVDVRRRMHNACEAAGRTDDDVTLIAVTKTHPLSDVRILCDLGIRDFGENRDQEAAPKAAQFQLEDGRDVRWHFIGQLQSNKARSVVQYASMVHTIDRPTLAVALIKAETPLDCLVQLSVDGDPARGGVPADALLALAERIEGPLRLRGIMAVAPLDMAAEAAFSEVARQHLRLRERYPEADVRCIGMSDDFETAIRHGATHVRVGSALLGHRAVL